MTAVTLMAALALVVAMAVRPLVAAVPMCRAVLVMLAMSMRHLLPMSGRPVFRIVSLMGLFVRVLRMFMSHRNTTPFVSFLSSYSIVRAAF